MFVLIIFLNCVSACYRGTFGLKLETMGPRKNSQSGNGNGDNEYLSRRARNNEAVKRSREKARQRAQETHTRVTKLKTENEMLEERIKLLSKELTFLKDIFMAHAGGSFEKISVRITCIRKERSG